MTDKMREDFDKWWDENYPFLKASKRDRENGWEGYQAATAESTAKIANLEMELAAWQGLHESSQIQKAQMQTELEAYRTKQRVYNSTEIAKMQARIDKSIKYFHSILASSSIGSSAHSIALEALAKVKDKK